MSAALYLLGWWMVYQHGRTLEQLKTFQRLAGMKTREPQPDWVHITLAFLWPLVSLFTLLFVLAVLLPQAFRRAR